MQRLSLVGLLFFSLSLFAASDVWNVDPEHTNVRFKVKHLMINWVHGELAGVKGTLTTPGTDKSKWKMDVSADPSTVDTKNAKRDTHLRDADFFDVKKFPTITFKSSKFEEKDGKLTVMGKLTLRGVTKDVTFDVESLTEPVKDPWNNMRRGFSATTKINRKDYGMKWNKMLDVGVAVGDEVFVTVDSEFVQPPATPAKKS